MRTELFNILILKLIIILVALLNQQDKKVLIPKSVQPMLY